MKHEWLLKRNCSLAPRQVAIAYGVMCLFAFAVAAVFAWYGVWIILAFAALEMAAVGLALLGYARHALDHEHIALSEGCLLVEQVQAGELKLIRLDPCWTRIALPDRKHTLIRLESRGVKVEIGRFVSEGTRQQVAQELRHELRASSFLA
jgi:uncharacterized membrane protein